MKFIIKIKDKRISAKSEAEAYDIAYDLVNDIAKNNGFKIVKEREKKS